MNKKHHIIPRVILKHFSDESKRLFVASPNCINTPRINDFSVVTLRNIADHNYEELDFYYQLAEQAIEDLNDAINFGYKNGLSKISISLHSTRKRILKSFFSEEYKSFGDSLSNEQKYIPLLMNKQLDNLILSSGVDPVEPVRYVASVLISRMEYLSEWYLKHQNLFHEHSNWQTIYNQVEIISVIKFETNIIVPVDENSEFLLIDLGDEQEEISPFLPIVYTKYLIPISNRNAILLRVKHISIYPIGMSKGYQETKILECFSKEVVNQINDRTLKRNKKLLMCIKK